MEGLKRLMNLKKQTKNRKKDEEIESLKIAVREINNQDISSRNLDKKTKA